MNSKMLLKTISCLNSKNQ